MILISLPFGRALTNQLREHHLLNLALVGAALFLVVIIVFLLALLRRVKSISLEKCRVILFLFLSFVVSTLPLDRPEERWHIYHYGILGILFWESYKGSGLLRLCVALISVSMCGFLEEIAQYFIPERVFDWRDVLLNCGSGIWSVFVLSWLEKRAPKPKD